MPKPLNTKNDPEISQRNSNKIVLDSYRTGNGQTGRKFRIDGEDDEVQRDELMEMPMHLELETPEKPQGESNNSQWPSPIKTERLGFSDEKNNSQYFAMKTEDRADRSNISPDRIDLYIQNQAQKNNKTFNTVTEVNS